MLLDILSSSNYISVNKKMAKVFNLNTAVYISVLLSIYSKANKKNALIDDKYIKIDRSYITRETTLSRDAQLLCDAELTAVGVMSKKDDNKMGNIICLDFETLICWSTDLSDEDMKILKNRIKCGASQYKQDKNEAKADRQFDKLMSCIMYEDNEDNRPLICAMQNWIRAILGKFGSKMVTDALILDFENKLNKYCQGDLDKALEIVGIATRLVYRDADWAIKSYEMNHKENKNGPRVTEQEYATAETIAKGISF